MASPGGQTVEMWLKGIDKSLCRYSEDFRRLDYNNTNILKFFSNEEFDNFDVKPSLAHRKMLLNAVAKLQTPKSKLGLETDEITKCNILKPKKLEFRGVQGNMDNSGYYRISGPEPEADFTFKTPTELMLADLEEKAKLTEVEIQSGREYVEDLKQRYANPTLRVSIDKTVSQCGKCHLRERHNRNRCPNGECLGPESCNDLDKHPTEKKFLSDAVSNLRAKEKELELTRQDIVNKKKAIKETQSSFKYQIQSALINSNITKYTFQTSNGRAMRQTAINNDAFVLEKHYRGHVPKNLAAEAKNFQYIIDKFNLENGIKTVTKKTVNPSKKLLEEKGVKFPRYSVLSPKSDSDEESQFERAVRESVRESVGSRSNARYTYTFSDENDDPCSSYSYHQEQEHVPPKKRFLWD